MSINLRKRYTTGAIGCLLGLTLMMTACGSDDSEPEIATGADSSTSTTESTTESTVAEQPTAAPTSPDQVAEGMVAFIVDNSEVTLLDIDALTAPGETVVTLTASNGSSDSLSIQADFLDGVITAQIGDDTWETTTLTGNSVGDTGWITVEATAVPTDDSATGDVSIKILGRAQSGDGEETTTATTEAAAATSSTTAAGGASAPIDVPTQPDDVAVGHVAFVVEQPDGTKSATVLAIDEFTAPGETVVELVASSSADDTLTIEADFLDGVITAQIGDDTWETTTLTGNSVGDTGWITVEATAVPTDDSATGDVSITILGRAPGATE